MVMSSTVRVVAATVTPEIAPPVMATSLAVRVPPVTVKLLLKMILLSAAICKASPARFIVFVAEPMSIFPPLALMELSDKLPILVKFGLSL